MKLIQSIAIASFAFTGVFAQAAELRGNDALVLAAALTDIVFPSSSAVLKRAIDNQCVGHGALNGTSSVTVQVIDCSLSNFALGSMNCFVDDHRVTGRQAYEIYSVISKVEGVADARAGSLLAATAVTSCLVDLGQLADCGGTGATCSVTPYPRDGR